MSETVKVIYNITGYPSKDFIQEIQDSQIQKKNQLWFALLVNGLPGDPQFGVGLSELAGEQNTLDLKRNIKVKTKKSLIELIEGIKFDGIVVEQVKEQQFMGIDIYYTDLDSNEQDIIPTGFKMNE